MTCLPYPSFVKHLPLVYDDEDEDEDDSNNKNEPKKKEKLSTTGSCRINPFAMTQLAPSSGSTGSNNDDMLFISRINEEYKLIYETNKKQSSMEKSIRDALNTSDETEKIKDNLDEMKILKKKYMKQGVALASSYLIQTLQLDVSIIDVEIVISSSHIIKTDGCICSCFLDAGCTAIVVINDDDTVMTTTLESTKIDDKTRLIASFRPTIDNNACEVRENERKEIQDALKFVNTISIDFTGHTYTTNTIDTTTTTAIPPETTARMLDKIDTILTYIPNKDQKIVIELDAPPSSLLSSDALKDENNDADVTTWWNTLIATVSSKCKDEKGRIALTDPTPYTLGMSYADCMRTDRPDKLYTTVVCTRAGEALGLVYSSKSSIVASLECGRGVYYTRSRKGLWRKGDTSGHYQILHRIDVDCDGDALRYTVTQCGGGGGDSNNIDGACASCGFDGPCFCHLKRFTCWGKACGLRDLEFTLQDRLRNAPNGSYTKRLFDDPNLLRDKLVEEAQELSEATTKEDVASELADVLYFAMARATKAGVSIDDAITVLDQRTKKVTRRKGDSKAFRIEAGNQILNMK